MTGLIADGVDWISAIAGRGGHHDRRGRGRRRGRKVFVVILISAHATVLGREKGGTGGRNSAHPVILG